MCGKESGRNSSRGEIKKWGFPFIGIIVQQLAALGMVEAAIWPMMFACDMKRVLEKCFYETGNLLSSSVMLLLAIFQTRYLAVKIFDV
jgi:hypothetical protein